MDGVDAAPLSLCSQSWRGWLGIHGRGGSCVGVWATGVGMGLVLVLVLGLGLGGLLRLGQFKVAACACVGRPVTLDWRSCPGG